MTEHMHAAEQERSGSSMELNRQNNNKTVRTAEAPFNASEQVCFHSRQIGMQLGWMDVHMCQACSLITLHHITYFIVL